MIFTHCIFCNKELLSNSSCLDISPALYCLETDNIKTENSYFTNINHCFNLHFNQNTLYKYNYGLRIKDNYIFIEKYLSKDYKVFINGIKVLNCSFPFKSFEDELSQIKTLLAFQ